jgi:hypothetical protein
MESNKEISIFISLNVVSNAERLLSVPKRSSGACVTAGEDPGAAGVRTGVTTASPGETDVWAGVFVGVPAWFLSTQPKVEAAIISTIKT